MQQKILITGGAGFIGTHLVNRLTSRYPAALEIVDDLSSSSVSEARAGFFRQHGIAFHETTVQKFRPDANVRYAQIYHLACRVGPAHVLDYAGRMASEILHDAQMMADLAIRDNAPLISISTSEVYGKTPAGEQQRENMPLQIPHETSARIEYTLAKLLTEKALFNLGNNEPRLRVNLIRPFNVVGPFQTGEGGYVLPRFVDAALRGEPITVFGDGTQTRSFTHVSDVVRSLILIMESGVRNKLYNVGSPANTCTIEELARRVIVLTSSTSEISYNDPKKLFGLRYTEAPSKMANIDLIVKELGWEPEWTLDEIIDDYAEFARNGAEEMAAAAA